MIIKQKAIKVSDEILNINISVPYINETFFENKNLLENEAKLIEFLEKYREENFNYVNNYII